MYRIYPSQGIRLIHIEKVVGAEYTRIAEFVLDSATVYLLTSQGDVIKYHADGNGTYEHTILSARSNMQSRHLHPEHDTPMVEITYPLLQWFAVSSDPPAWADE